ncbi:MAG TPA: pyridoxal-dependent decarboxylase, partial [Candidatus Acidoferrum sp.]|nr:pyridoxal-dependent decarboxylase [Candidatus Acidoferrum sp.]
EVVDLMADYLARVEDYPVFPPIEPGSLGPLFPAAAPERPEPIAAILADYGRLIEPNSTHWQHPGFLAYFGTTASGPGILGEMFTAVLGQNAMLWRTSPIATELEGVVVGWLRDALGLPAAFDGLITDTASTSSLIALAGARQAAGIDVAADGIRVGPDRFRVYASAEAHSSIEKALMTLGLGRSGLVRVATNDRFEMDAGELQVAIDEDRDVDGVLPIAIVATVGTTSSTSVDPVVAIADIAEREGLWLHVDAAYAGSLAIVPERRAPFAGWERADSIVVNPHKWLFAPLDASLLLTRRMDVLQAAFSLVPEYLRTLDRDTPVRDYNEYTPQLGRRFRALKLLMLLRAFGLEGLRRRLIHHCAMAEEFAAWVDADPAWERMAPTPFSTVCFRHIPAGMSDEADIDAHNAELMDAVNRTGKVFLSHTRLNGRFAIRLAIGNVRTQEVHVARAWELLRQAAVKEKS